MTSIHLADCLILVNCSFFASVNAVYFVMTVSVWADDQWLVEHAGATLKKTDEADEENEEADTAAEKDVDGTVETVCKQRTGAYFGSLSVFFSVCFNDHFSDGLGLAGTRMSPSCILLELRSLFWLMQTKKYSFQWHAYLRASIYWPNCFYCSVLPYLTSPMTCLSFSFSTLTLLVGARKGIRPVKKTGCSFVC